MGRNDRDPKIVLGRCITGRVELGAVALRPLPLLFDGNQLNVAIHQHHHDHRQVQTRGRRHFTGHHEKTAIAGYADHRVLWPAKFGRDGRRNAESHRRPAIGHDQLPRPRRAPQLPNEMRVRPHITRQIALIWQHLPDRPHDTSGR